MKMESSEAAGREWILERERREGEERKEEPVMVLSPPNHLNPDAADP